ncbi:MAG TPA: zinc-dependent alcohol dehydrogenase family protein [Gammaproteobacteria bacterium]|nr:zinc-dependent alcohol dehydrogenase family protein [Gammaproteobacteria bacterium]
MVAQVIEQHGGPDVFKTLTIQTPKIKPEHILIRVEASSVNPVDYKIRKGMSPWLSPALPAVLHSDVAGVVVEVGEGVRHFKEGDEVYGCAGGFKGNGGALAEYMLADARLLAHKPRSLSMVESAAMPLVAITAFEALFDRAKLKYGQTILIQGAAGGVGHLAVQFAILQGANVYATASSTEKLSLVKEYGAIGINYREKKVEEYVQEFTDGKGFDVVMNTVGGASLADAFTACANNGVVVGISSSATYDLSPMHKKGLSLHIVFMPGPLVNNVGRERHGEILKEVAILVDKGLVKPLISRVFPFSQVGAAHQYLETGPTMGKVGLKQDLNERKDDNTTKIRPL